MINPFKFFKQRERIAELEHELLRLKSTLNNSNTLVYEARMQLARERMNRRAVMNFLKVSTVKRTNDDGTTTLTLTSFVTDLDNLFVSREEMGVRDSP